MGNVFKVFDIRVWKKKLTNLLKEHPELQKLPGKLGIYTNGDNVCKVKVEDKEIK